MVGASAGEASTGAANGGQHLTRAYSVSIPCSSSPPPASTPSSSSTARATPRRRRPLPRAVSHGRDVLGDAAQATRREFLLTSGTGGYASASLAGTLTRSYHGLLIAALRPPLDRTLLLSALDEVVTYLGESYCLAPHPFALIDGEAARHAAASVAEGDVGVFAANGRSGSVNAVVTAAAVNEAREKRHASLVDAAVTPLSPVRRGIAQSPRQQQPAHLGAGAADAAGGPGLGAAVLLESFRLEGTTPVFTYAIGDALLEKRLWLKRGTNAVFVRYKLLRATRPLSLSVNAIVNHRDHHARTHASRPCFVHSISAPAKRTVVVDFIPGDDHTEAHPPTRLVLRSSRGRADPANVWVSGGVLHRERERGLPDTDDHIHAASFWMDLLPGSSATIVAAALDAAGGEPLVDRRGQPDDSAEWIEDEASGGDDPADAVPNLPAYIAEIRADEEMEEVRAYETALLDDFYHAREGHLRRAASRRSKNFKRMSSSLSIRSDSSSSNMFRSPPPLVCGRASLPSYPPSPPPIHHGNGLSLSNGGSFANGAVKHGSALDFEDPMNKPLVEQLVLAADQFIVERRDGKSVMAGYPWFQDYSRDTFIALPGLAITCGRLSVARDVILTFAKFVSCGMLPNRFPDTGSTPASSDYNTADGTLWYFESIRAYYAVSKDIDLLRELFPVLCDVVDHHVKGTRFGIQQDPKDGLLRSGIDGLALTWMDAVCDGHVFTPRIGKPVELAALWFNALSVMAAFAADLGFDEDERKFATMAAKSERGFRRFWNEDAGYCYDVIDTGPDGQQVDVSLRPNQLFAVSLQWSPLSSEQHAQIVAACSHSLLTSYGMRTLPPSAHGYRGTYAGNVVARDSAYHCGTVWSWLIGPFVSAHLRAHGDRRAARAFLEPLLSTLSGQGQGTFSEVYDGDPPFRPRGCIAQAWSVGEFLRVWIETEPEQGI